LLVKIRGTEDLRKIISSTSSNIIAVAIIMDSSITAASIDMVIDINTMVSADIIQNIIEVIGVHGILGKIIVVIIGERTVKVDTIEEMVSCILNLKTKAVDLYSQ
jgi:hypothetical protein